MCVIHKAVEEAHCTWLISLSANHWFPAHDLHKTTRHLDRINKELHSSLFVASLEDCWKMHLCKSHKQKKNLWSCDRTVTSPTSHIATVSVCSHWLVSPSEPAGCDCLAHNATGKTRALDSHWSADGCERGISSVLQSTHPELCMCVFLYLYSCLCIYCIMWFRSIGISNKSTRTAMYFFLGVYLLFY